MIIDREYIIQRINALVIEKQQTLFMSKPQSSRIKSFLRNFRKLCPAPMKRLLRKFLQKRIASTWVRQFVPCDVAFDFVNYLLTTDCRLFFATNDFFATNEEEYIQNHIDDRLKTVFWETQTRVGNANEVNFLRLNNELQSRIKKRRGFYCLNYEDKSYELPKNHFESGIWLYHYGLKSLPSKVKQYIVGKDFLDVGAFIGDSALMLLNYQPKQIFAYEPCTWIYHDLQKTIERNQVNDKITLVHKGLGDKPGTMSLNVAGNASSFLFQSGRLTETVEITTIDAECNDRCVGVIKMDIEGFEYFAVKGALKTIRRDKPILLISIYHTGKDFFEIPPMLKNVVPEYKFTIVDTLPTTIADKILVCYME